MVDISNGVNLHELTRQLAEQAELLQFVNGMTCYRQQHKLEKFAQLIVQECSSVAIDNGCGDFVDIEQKLFEHFGVET
jgi:hypothetical protein